MEGIHCSQFVFYNDFDSANLAKVEFVPPNNSGVCCSKQSVHKNANQTVEVVHAEFNIWTRPDCGGTEFENGNRTWFYFAMKAPEPCLLVKINMVNLNKQGKMYSQGMAPVYRILPNKPKWDRIHDKPLFSYENDIFTLTFKYRTPENLDSCTYFAFTYPYSYVELDKMLVNIDAKYFTIERVSESDIYYVRETICHSIEGRRIDLITISSFHGITSDRELRLKSLFSDTTIERPHKFVGKKIIFVSARVHPGETPSTYVFNGLLNLLLNRDDLVAQMLRKLYVFKLIPFLNPDGVARGHYRTDTRGANLNRVYLNPSLTEHPSIFAARALIRYYHYGCEKEDKIPQCDNCKLGIEPVSSVSEEDDEEINNRTESLTQMAHMSLDEDQASMPWCTRWHNFCRTCGAQLTHTVSREEIKFEAVNAAHQGGDVNRNNDPSSASDLFLYVDLHGHASKKGVFMYGNHFDDLDRRVECMLLPKLMSLNNHHFHFQGCNFTERNMYLRDKRDGMSRAGSGRVAVLSLTGMIKSYTLECNYNTGRLVNVLPATIREPNGKVHTLAVPPKYTPQIFEEVGKSLGASILDLTSQNPFSRLPNSEFHTLAGLREWLRNSCSTNDFGPDNCPRVTRMRNKSGAVGNATASAGLRSQGKPRGVIIKNRQPLAKTVLKKIGKSSRSTLIPVERKENLVVGHPSTSTFAAGSASVKTPSTPSASRSTTNAMRMNKMIFKSRINKDLTLKTKNVACGADAKASASLYSKRRAGYEHQTQAAKLCNRRAVKDDSMKAASTGSNIGNSSSSSEIHLKEICFIKGPEGGKTMIAKYNKGTKNSENFDDSLVVSWDAPTCTNATVFTHKSRVASAPSLSEPGTSASKKGNTGVFRVHNFAKSSSLVRSGKMKNKTLRRLASAVELGGKTDKKMKKKKLKVK